MKAIITFLTAALPLMPAARAQQPDDPFARDIKIMAQWFEGEFDNEEQLWFEADPRSATPTSERHVRIHTLHRRLSMPSFGEFVFYVEEYKDNNPDQVIRQRLVTLTSDRTANAIRMQQGFFKDPAAARGASSDPDKLAGLTAANVFFVGECDVFWRRKADQFEGAMADKACVFGEGKERRYSVHNLTLSATKFWRVDSTFKVSDDSLHVGMPIDQPFELRRAKIFICEAAFRNENQTGYDSGQIIKDLRLHSQGGLVWITREVDGARYGLRLRDKEYPYYEQRPDFLFFSIRQPDSPRSVAYSVHDSDSRRLGINLNWMSANCHRQGYEFREPLELLE